MKLPRYDILIIDDNLINLDVMTNFLEGSGFTAYVAYNGEDGLEKAQDIQPDLILLDVMMPGIDGFETCRHLKANPDTRDIPVIFMTALSNPTDKVKGFEAGGVDLLSKAH